MLNSSAKNITNQMKSKSNDENIENFAWKTYCFYKKRRRESACMQGNIQNTSSNNINVSTIIIKIEEKNHCLLCRKIIEFSYEENMCVECCLRKDPSNKYNHNFININDVYSRRNNNNKNNNNRNNNNKISSSSSTTTTTNSSSSSITSNNKHNNHIHYNDNNYDQQEVNEKNNNNKIHNNKKLVNNKSNDNNNYKNINNSSEKCSKMCKLIHQIKNIRKSLLVLIFISNILFSSIHLVNAQTTRINVNGKIANSSSNSNEKEPGICRSIDIRNDPKYLSKLENCTVIEGFLQITLIDRYDTKSFVNYKFPKLVEVTDYVLLYRVNGLLTLRELFPNLSVIRGNSLIDNNALVIYEMLNMQEIGLVSLQKIIRGYVRIEKNPNLCYADTIDWTMIAVGSMGSDHFIDGNKHHNECPVCLKHPKNNKTSECPKSSLHSKKDRYLCWNDQHCQKECPSRCPGNCYDSETCCADHCAGGCAGPSPTEISDCKACKMYIDYKNGKKKCVSKCDNGFYVFGGRRCVSKEDCQNIPRPIGLSLKHKEIQFPYVAYNGTCSINCPPQFFAEVHCTNQLDPKSCRKQCIRCVGRCEKTCPSTVIDSISAAQNLAECTKIEGALEISIRSQGSTNIVKELEKSLALLEEITEHLKIVRSYPLISLHFFKSLKRIGGENLDSRDGKALLVIDNPNLQDLFNPNRTIVIGQGKIAFHYNPKLCLYKIEAFKSKLSSNIQYDSYDSTKNTNGDKIACNVTTMNANVTSVSHQFAVISWDKFEYDDYRSLLGYVVYYTEAPYQNVTLYEGRDACGMDGWEIDDVGPEDTIHPVTRLKPNTQYAYYVKTLMISSENYGGQSPIQYFVTLPGTPEKVKQMDVASNASSEIVVNWKPPKKFNGIPASYEITVHLTESKDIIYLRDFCLEPLKEGEDISYGTEKKSTEDSKDKTVCNCEEVKCDKYGAGSLDEYRTVESITFEDKLQNWVYIKDTKSSSGNRKRREISIIEESPLFQTTTMMALIQATQTQSHHGEEGEITEANSHVYRKVRTNETSLVIKGLKHYSSYSVAVRACRLYDVNENKLNEKPDLCSPPTYRSAQTRAVPGADDITEFTAMLEQTNSSLGAIKISWTPPVDPNGLIVSYSIKYYRGDFDTKTRPQCVTAKDFENNDKTYLIRNLEPGNYTIQVLATSMYGDGNYTEPRFVEIPEPTNHVHTIIIATFILLFVTFAGAAILIYYFRRKFPPPVANMKLIASVNPEYVSMQYTPDEWEVPREKIIQLQELGQGSFGMVYAGIVKDLNGPGEELRCAIKTVNENATDRERINFLKEASVMKGFDTFHVVKLLGVVSSGQPTLVIMELMGNGDLKGYLRSHRPDRESLDGPAPQPPSLKRVYQMAIEIADGMSYLAFKKFVHRDLAARNCMVADDLTVKIGDFGMTRDIYETDYYRKGTKGLLPVRWMAPESLKDGVFTSSSDVFSYGVVLWEMATLASQPYQGLSNDQVLRYVIDGGVMERPENCPDKLYDLMRRCWTHRPSARPSFMEIVSELVSDASDVFKQVSFYSSIEGQRYYQEIQNVPTLDDVTTPLTRPEEDDESSIDGDHYLTNRTNSHHLHRDGTLPAVRTSQPLSGGIGSGIFTNDPLAQMSYRIDEEDSADAFDSNQDVQEKEDLNRLNAVVAEVPQPRLNNSNGNSNSKQSPVATQNTTEPHVLYPAHDYIGYSEHPFSWYKPRFKNASNREGEITPNHLGMSGNNDLDDALPQHSQQQLIPSLPASQRRTTSDFLSSNPSTNSCNDIDEDIDEDDEFTLICNDRKNNVKLTPNKHRKTGTGETEEELRPLSNGYLVQNS